MYLCHISLDIFVKCQFVILLYLIDCTLIYRYEWGGTSKMSFYCICLMFLICLLCQIIFFSCSYVLQSVLIESFKKLFGSESGIYRQHNEFMFVCFTAIYLNDCLSQMRSRLQLFHSMYCLYLNNSFVYSMIALLYDETQFYVCNCVCTLVSLNEYLCGVGSGRAQVPEQLMEPHIYP